MPCVVIWLIEPRSSLAVELLPPGARQGGVDMAAVEPLRDRPAGRRAATILMSLDINGVSVIGNSSRPPRNKEQTKIALA